MLTGSYKLMIFPSTLTHTSTDNQGIEPKPQPQREHGSHIFVHSKKIIMKILKYILAFFALLFIAFFALGFFISEHDYSNSVRVEKNIAETWQASQDESKMAGWLPGFQKIEHVSGTPGTVGAVSKVYFEQEGQPMIITETIQSIEPMESVSMHFSSDFMEMDYQMVFEAVEEGTTITSETHVEGNGMFAKSVLALMGSSLKTQEQTNLENLKKSIEQD